MSLNLPLFCVQFPSLNRPVVFFDNTSDTQITTILIALRVLSYRGELADHHQRRETPAYSDGAAL